MSTIYNKPDTNTLPCDENVSGYLQGLAGQSNWALNTGNIQTATQLMNQLFDACYGRNGYKLLQLDDDATQAVGLAFTSIARYLNFNDRDLNSVAAENAVYCLSRNIINKDNSFCAPAIFTLLLNYENLLKDKLISAHSEMAQKDVGLPIGRMLGGNPFNAPHLEGFREQAVSKRVPVMAYLLSLFYDERKHEFTIPTDMPYHLPKQVDLNKYHNLKKEYNASDNSLLVEGQKYFYQIFEECKDSLLTTMRM